MMNLLTTKELAEVLKLHPNTITKWVKSGRIKAAAKVSKRDFRFELESVLAQLDEKEGL